MSETAVNPVMKLDASEEATRYVDRNDEGYRFVIVGVTRGAERVERVCDTLEAARDNVGRMAAYAALVDFDKGQLVSDAVAYVIVRTPHSVR